jgi:putative redox protein
MNTPSIAEIIIARCQVSSAAEDPDYRQSIRCGQHEMIADERAPQGGADAGARPFEYLLAGLGACTLITLRMYAHRKGWNIGAAAVSLSLRQAKDGRKIDRRVTLSGALRAEQLAKLSEISEKTPVTLVIKSGIDVRTVLATASLESMGQPRGP